MRTAPLTELPRPDSDETIDDTAPARDEVFSVLSNRRRRLVLYCLHERGETTLTELSRQVAAWENGIPTGAVTHTQRKRVYTALHQNHLPKLREAGVVTYSRARTDIRLAPGATAVTRHLLDDATDEGRSLPLVVAALLTPALQVALVTFTPLPLHVALFLGGLSFVAGAIWPLARGTVSGADATSEVPGDVSSE